MRVLKFGGSCLQDGSGLARVVELVEATPAPLCVVVSALQGVTDRLRDLAFAAGSGATPDVTPLLDAHARLLEPLAGPHREIAGRELEALRLELIQALNAVREGGATPPLLDPVLGWGERASARLALAHLAQAGLEASLRVGAAAGVVTDAGFGHARFRPEAAARARELLAGETRVVVPGFVGQTPDGAWTTLGRGGSDTTAAFLGLALDAPVTLWKDTALLSADPQLVPDARVLRAVDPHDALELATAGLPAIAADALELVRRDHPLEVRAFLGEAHSQIAAGATATAVVWVAHEPGRVRVTLVGAPGEPATLDARAVDCLRAAGVEAAAGALTPSGRNHAWSVPAAAYPAAVRALHRAFVEDDI